MRGPRREFWAMHCVDVIVGGYYGRGKIARQCRGAVGSWTAERIPGPIRSKGITVRIHPLRQDCVFSSRS